MEEHSRVLSILGGIAMSIVGFQICRKVLPWIYANVLGPRLCGPSVNLAEMGEWAGEWSGVHFVHGAAISVVHSN